MEVLLKFSHGLGDIVQLTCVLLHLLSLHPDWVIDVASHVGKHSALHGLCRRSLILDRGPIDHAQYRLVFDLGWYECYSVFSDSPSTKVCNTLREVFGIVPELALLKYRIEVGDDSREKTREYLSAITEAPAHDGRFPVVAVHYQSNTSAWKKDLRHEVVANLCRELILHGFTPLILDWDRRSPLPDQKRIFCPGVGPGDLWGNTGTGDARLLAALLSQCALVIGVDSGPLHVAGATETPTLGVWTGHSPVQFYDLCPNVTHLVPNTWRTVPPCQNPTAARFMEAHYALRTYGDLEPALLEAAFDVLGGASAELRDLRCVTAHQPREPPAAAAAANGKLNGTMTKTFSGHTPLETSIRSPRMVTTLLNLPSLITWERLPGSATEIAIGADDSLWCLGIREIGSDGRSIHRWNGSNWEDIPGQAVKMAIAPDGTAFIVNGHGQILRHTGTEWQPMPGLAREIAVGAGGALWCVSAADVCPGGGSIHVWNGSDWDRVDGAAVKIAVGPNGDPWIINSAGQIFRRSGEGWELLPGLARELALTVAGDVCCLGMAQAPSGGYSILRWNGAGWDPLSGAAVRIAAARWIMVVNSEHNIFRAV